MTSATIRADSQIPEFCAPQLSRRKDGINLQHRTYQGGVLIRLSPVLRNAKGYCGMQRVNGRFFLKKFDFFRKSSVKNDDFYLLFVFQVAEVGANFTF